MMLGFLLARAGVEVLVLEKHADFLRDFRGDTIHPSTLQIMHELGILNELLKRPHQELKQVKAQIGTSTITVADFSHLPLRSKFIAFMPQWEFLNLLAEQARQYSNFQIRMQAEVVDIIEENGRIAGVRANTPDGALEINADLTVGADGRRSTVREKAGLEIVNLGAPIDVLWMRLSKQQSDPEQSLGRIDAGKLLVMLDRGDYWQCAYVIPKGRFDEIRRKGLPLFREDIADSAPFLRNRVDELTDWSEIKLLTVMVDRLAHWYRPGLLCIGDAAHAMSPIGGVGINLAIQDAVAAANVLASPLARAAVTNKHLGDIQRRRDLPTRITQRLQVLIQDRVISRVLSSTKHISVPFPMKLLRSWPLLRRIPARAIGMGFRPEHVRTPEIRKSRNMGTASPIGR
jgi:2-polyprenyl-6-methoxyphenol hydroxylase-like FAD-dependent oxidoreductase